MDLVCIIGQSIEPLVYSYAVVTSLVVFLTYIAIGESIQLILVWYKT